MMEIIILITMSFLIFVYACLTNKYAMLHYAFRVHRILEHALRLCQYFIKWLEEI